MEQGMTRSKVHATEEQRGGRMEARATAAAGARAMALGGAVAGARALERSAARAAGFGPLAAPALSQARLCLGLLLLAC